MPEYGLLLFVMSLSASLYLLDIGMSYVLVQPYVVALRSHDRTYLNDLLGTTFVALAFLGTVGALILAGLSQLLPGPFNIPHPYIHEASTIVIVSAFAIQFGLPTAAIEQIYQASHRFDRLNQFQLLTSTVQMVLSVAVLAAGFRIVALALVQFVVTALRLLVLAVALPGTVPNARLSLTRFQWRLLRPLIGLGKWMFLTRISICALELLVWTVLGALASMREAALFGLASKLPTQLWNLVDRGSNVFLPSLSKSSAEADWSMLRLTYLKIQKLVFGAVLPFVVLGCVFARPLIQVWAGAQYIGAAPAMQWLLLALFAHAVAYPSYQLLYVCAQLRKGTVITFWSVIMSAACCLLPGWHYRAAGLAAAVALPPLLITCCWLTPLACRLTHTTPRVLLRVGFSGLTWPLIALSAEVALVLGLWPLLSPFWLVFAAIVSGGVYLGVWGVYTGLPLYRNQTELKS